MKLIKILNYFESKNGSSVYSTLYCIPIKLWLENQFSSYEI